MNNKKRNRKMNEAIGLLIKELEEEKHSDQDFLRKACREMDDKEYTRVYGIFTARMGALGECIDKLRDITKIKEQ